MQDSAAIAAPTDLPAPAASLPIPAATPPVPLPAPVPTNSIWDPAHWNLDVWFAVAGTPAICLVGIVLTALLLPGVWLMVLWALILKLWQPDLISWWSFVVILMLAALGEGLEFIASALGAAKAGGSKHGAIGAMLGSFAGAIVGIIVPPPIIGSIVSAAAGAAGGAILGERWLNKSSWEAATKVGTGAAIGRLLATVAKVLVAILVGAVLCIAVVR